MPNDVSLSLGESASVNLWQCVSLFSSRMRPCWKYSRSRETDQKGKQILSLEISCSSGSVCRYYKCLEIYAGQQRKQLLLAISNDCYQFYCSQAGKHSPVKNTGVSNLDCSDNVHYCFGVFLLSIFATSWLTALLPTHKMQGVCSEQFSNHGHAGFAAFLRLTLLRLLSWQSWQLCSRDWSETPQFQ